MKLIVAGSRNYTNQRKVFKVLDKMTEVLDLEIVSGLAKGPDTFGKLWAESNGIIVHPFPANWDKYGKSAGYIRNEKMAIFADGLLAFWDGKSRGTAHMIDLAHKHGIKVAVIHG